MKLRIGARGSPLALWQARHAASLILELHPQVNIELVTIKTTGDKILDAPLSTIGGKGLFTKEIEEALLEDRVDLAVHSMKDVPTELPDGLKLAAILKREDPRDVFISRDARGLEELKLGERIGTSSLRRRAFLLNRFPGLEIVSIRGNVDTRIKKIEKENLAGIVLASAGIKRMGFVDRATSFLDTEVMVPAIGQGALGIEIRVDDPTVEAVVSQLNHENTAACVLIERTFLARMGGGCQVPLAAHAVLGPDGISVIAAVVHPDGRPVMKESYSGPDGDSDIGARLADALIQKGADKIMRSVTGNDWEPGPTGDLT
ncbi:MAG: hydroxymethylbilane synthase [Deltaproteobacteria bacterium]|nr:hydroxymethylbilane synthase [Deltaproteobacteria bacterium]